MSRRTSSLVTAFSFPFFRVRAIFPRPLSRPGSLFLHATTAPLDQSHSDPRSSNCTARVDFPCASGCGDLLRGLALPEMVRCAVVDGAHTQAQPFAQQGSPSITGETRTGVLRVLRGQLS